jgi:hypothetical protein
MIPTVGVTYPVEILRSVADRMAHAGHGMPPVVERADARHPAGPVNRFDFLEGCAEVLEDMRHTEGLLGLRGPCTDGTATVADNAPLAPMHIGSLDGAMPTHPRS